MTAVTDALVAGPSCRFAECLQESYSHSGRQTARGDCSLRAVPEITKQKKLCWLVAISKVATATGQQRERPIVSMKVCSSTKYCKVHKQLPCRETPAYIAKDKK